MGSLVLPLTCIGHECALWVTQHSRLIESCSLKVLLGQEANFRVRSLVSVPLPLPEDMPDPRACG